MYSGEAVETGSIEDVFDKMRHPYTQALFRSIPCQVPTKTRVPWLRSRQLPLPHERPTVTLARVAIISRKAAVTPPKSQCPRLQAMIVMPALFEICGN